MPDENPGSSPHAAFGAILSRLIARADVAPTEPDQVLEMMVPEVDRLLGPHREVLTILEGDPAHLFVAAHHGTSLPAGEHVISSGCDKLLAHLREGNHLHFRGRSEVAGVTLRFAVSDEEGLLVLPLRCSGELVGAWLIGAEPQRLADPGMETQLGQLSRFLGPLVGWTSLRASIGRRYGHLPQTERLAELGRLVAGVAHELSSPLQSIISMAELLEREPGRTDPREASHRILRSAMRCRGIVQDLLGFARKDSDDLERVKVQDVLLDALDLDRLGDVGEIQIRVESDDEIPDVQADTQRLGQVFLNLITNARHAVEESGRTELVVLELTHVPANRSRLSVPQHVPVVRVVVADKGRGVPPEIRPRIFEPFFTTKEMGVGSGLGLSVSRSLVTGMGGVLYLEDSSAAGARFVVELPGLPPAESEMATALDDLEEDLADGHPPCRILLIDDDRDVLDTYEAVLALDDHVVRCCDRAQKALQALENDPFDVILCDIRLPDMSGPAFLEVVKQDLPHMAARIVFATGDVINDSTRAFLASVPNPTLIKPFRLEDLYSAMRAVNTGSR